MKPRKEIPTVVEESSAWTDWWVCIRDVAFPIHLLKENSSKTQTSFLYCLEIGFYPYTYFYTYK